MGLPVSKLIVATNRNDILARFFAGGEYRKDGVTPTISPSMDIQVASNFERLLFDMHGRDGPQLRGLLAELATAIGRASCRARVCQCGENSVVAVAVKKKKTN